MSAHLSLSQMAVQGMQAMVFGVWPYVAFGVMVWGIWRRVRIWRGMMPADSGRLTPARVFYGPSAAAKGFFFTGKRRIFGGTLRVIFHICLLLIALRHLRYFIYPVPDFVLALQKPGLYAGCLFPAACLVLLWRRLVVKQVMYQSRGADFYPLILLLLVSTSGLGLTFLFPPDLVQIKTWGLGVVTFRPQIQNHSILWGLHLLAALLFIASIPFSKLLHPLSFFFMRPLFAASKSFPAAGGHESPDDMDGI